MKGAPEVIEAVWSDISTEAQAIELGEACRLGFGKDLRERIEVGLILRTSVPQIGEIINRWCTRVQMCRAAV